MARLPGLIAALAATDGRDTKSLAWVARVAREQGLITTTKRGVGASRMSARDAANLLIAANVADGPRGLEARTELVRAFVPSWPEIAEDSIFGEISRAATCGEALTKAIAGAPEIALLVLAHVKKRFAAEPNAAPCDAAPSMNFAGFDVEFKSRGGAPMTVKLTLWELVGRERREHYVFKFMGDATLIESGYYARHNGFDRHVTATVGLKTLLHLSSAVIGTDEAFVEDMPEKIAEIGAALDSKE